MRDALRLDYKAFTATITTVGPLRYGMSSVLVPAEGETKQKTLHMTKFHPISFQTHVTPRQTS